MEMNQPNDDQKVTRLRPAHRSHAERLAAWKARRKEETRLAWCQIIGGEPSDTIGTADEEGPAHIIL